MSVCRRSVALSAVCLAAFLAVVAAARAQDTAPDRPLTDEVFAQLLAVAEPAAEFEWPPALEVSAEDTAKAHVTAAPAQDRDGKPSAKVVITEGMLEAVIQEDPDRLAFVLGHELAHIVLGHVGPESGHERTPFVRSVFNRQQETEADQKGMELALAAGYSYRRALKAIHRMMELGLEYSSFEGLGTDHPSWKDRLTLLDEEQASLWGAMSAFDNGTVFLLVEQYGAAERCFRRVVKEFPSCYEAWANLGYALLMQYCDALETDDLRRFGIGQIVCGGFYRRPASLEARVRGVDEELWWDAVGALREALRLAPDLTLAKANLGIAYLVRPAGKDVGQATEYLHAAVDAAQRDETLAPLARAAVLINAGVADLADGNRELCAQRLEGAAQEGGRAFAGQARHVLPRHTISSALLYNSALVLAGSNEADELRGALVLLEGYLRVATPASAWWPLAYARYEQVCEQLGIAARSQEQLRPRREGPLRQVTSVAVGSGHLITLTDPVSDVQERLGAGEAVPVVAGTNLRRLRYARYGVDVLVSDEVLAICLVGPSSPALTIRGAGLGAGSATVRVGMTGDELEQALADEDYDFRQLTDPDVNYRFYRGLGLAVRVKGGVVRELVVVQLPERAIPGTG